MRRGSLVLVIVGCVGAVWPGAVSAGPRGCASITNDYAVGADVARRIVDVQVNRDGPCTFHYEPGDTYSGNGRFTVRCESGGFVDHRDNDDGQHPPAVNLLIPGPCFAGDVVTVNGFRFGTGGAVVAGGAHTEPPATPVLETADYRAACAPGSESEASVRMDPPVGRSATLSYTGTVRCDGASVQITSLTVTPLGHTPESAGTAACTACDTALSVTGSTPATLNEYEVAMDFEVTALGQDTIRGHRVGRFFAGWAGGINGLCADVDPRDVEVPQPFENCPV